MRGLLTVRAYCWTSNTSLNDVTVSDDFTSTRAAADLGGHHNKLVNLIIRLRNARVVNEDIALTMRLVLRVVGVDEAASDAVGVYGVLGY
jgi:hypothetical protein